MEILNKIQKELKCPKNQMNTFGNYKFRNCEDILEAVKPLLGTATLVLNDEIVMIGDRYYVKATAILTDGNNKVSSTAFARESLDKKGMDVAQITGAASSYARKYALNGLFCIDDTKDADTTNTQNGNDVEYISPAEVSNLLDLLLGAKGTEASFVKFMKAESLEKILKKDYQKAVNTLKAAKK